MTTTPLHRRGPVLRLLAICLLAEIGYAELNLSTMPIYLQKDRHFGESVIGLIIVSFLLAEAVFKGPMGALADRVGPKKLIVLGPALSVFSAVLSILVPHTGAGPLEIVAFVVLRLFDGIALAMLWPAAFAHMNATVDDADRQGAMSLLNLVYMVGIALAFPIGGMVNDLSGVRWAGLVLAAVLFLGTAIAARSLLPDTRAVHHDEEHKSDPGAFLRSIKTIPEYLILAFVTFIGIGFPSAIFKLFPIHQFGFSESGVGFVIMPGAIALALLSVPMSKLGERIGRTKAVHYGLALCAFGMAMIGAGMVLPFLRVPAMLLLGGLPVGVGFLLTIPAWMAAVSDADPRNRGANIGAVMTAQGLGAIVGAPIGATMYEKLQPLGKAIGLGADFGRYAPFAACSVAVAAGWLLSLRILRDHVPTTPDPGLDVLDAVGPVTPEIEPVDLSLPDGPSVSDQSQRKHSGIETVASSDGRTSPSPSGADAVHASPAVPRE